MEPIKRDTPMNVLLAAMEKCEDADGIVVIVTKRDPDDPTIGLYWTVALESMTVAQLAWLYDRAKWQLMQNAILGD